MLSTEISKLENENQILKRELTELREKMDRNEIQKPKSCQYCMNYVQHYIKTGIPFKMDYTPIYAGHCTCGVPIKNGGKKNVKPDDSCQYFEIGTNELKNLL